MNEVVLFGELVFWHWWIFAAALLVIELLIPTTFLLWPGVAAIALGFVLLLIPELQWELQLIVFGLFSVTALILHKIYLNKRPIETDQPLLNRRGEQYLSRIFTLDEPIVNGVGKIKVDDTHWRIEGEDCTVGQKVKVIGVSGSSLKVSKHPID